MPLPSFLQRKDKPAPQRRAKPAAAAGPADEGGPVQEARIRARRRLIGAAVLLLVGVVGFPLLFETAPRPVAVDIPIETVRKGSSGGVVQSLPAAPPADEARPAAASPVPAASGVLAEAPQEVIEPAPAPPKAVPAAPAQPAPDVKPAPPAVKPPASAAAPRPAATTDAQRARALLDDKPVAAAATTAAAASKDGRYVVQVGAYTDSAGLRDTRQKVEKLGLKTYTQVIETDAGKRTRVRIGPFATREEADRAGARLKAAGLPAAILTL
jgi:DedD protein